MELNIDVITDCGDNNNNEHRSLQTNELIHFNFNLEIILHFELSHSLMVMLTESVQIGVVNVFGWMTSA